MDEGRRPFRPQDVAGLSAWLDAAAPWTLYQDTAGTTLAEDDGTPVALWQDRSGNGCHAVQASSALRAARRSAQRNGLPALQFDGVDDRFDASPYSYPAATTYVAAVSLDASISTGAYIAGAIGGGANGSGLLIVSNTLTGVIFSPTSTTTVQDNAPYGGGFAVVAGVVDGAQGEAFVNGMGNGATAGGNVAQPGVPLRIGHRGGGSNVLPGRLAELLVYGRALSPRERLSVERYLAAKWGIAQ